MKQIIQLSILCLVLVCLVSCKSPSSSDNDSSQDNQTVTSGVTFKVTTECDTPEGEAVVLRYHDSWPGLYKMEKTGDNTWKLTMNLDSLVGRSFKYRYCRQYMYNGAEESFDDRNKTGWRTIVIPSQNFHQEDTISKWRWWPKDGKIPEIDTTGYTRTLPEHLPRKSFHTGVWLPDYWWECFTYTYKKTIDKIKEIAQANWIQYSPVLIVTQYFPLPVIELWENTESEEQLIEIIKYTHEQGLKFFLRPFSYIDGEMQSLAHTPYHTKEWWRAFEKQWRPFMIHYAELAEKYDVEMLQFLMWPGSAAPQNPDEELATIDQLARALLADVRKVYNGKIVVDFEQSEVDLQVFGEGDYLGTPICAYYPYELGKSKSTPMTSLAENLEKNLDDRMYKLYKKWGKPIMISSMVASSYNGGIINQPDWGSVLYWDEDDPAVKIDCQEQADILEAMLSVLTKKSWIKGVYSFNYNYWDSIDKTPSIRAKPAEKEVVAKWYKWIRGVE